MAWILWNILTFKDFENIHLNFNDEEIAYGKWDNLLAELSMKNAPKYWDIENILRDELESLWVLSKDWSSIKERGTIDIFDTDENWKDWEDNIIVKRFRYENFFENWWTWELKEVFFRKLSKPYDFIKVFWNHKPLLNIIKQKLKEGKSIIISWNPGSWKSTFWWSFIEMLNDNTPETITKKLLSKILESYNIEIGDIEKKTVIELKEQLSALWVNVATIDRFIATNPLIDITNFTNFKWKVFTIENPIEYKFKNNRLKFVQVEVAEDKYQHTLEKTLRATAKLFYMTEIRTNVEYDTYLNWTLLWRPIFTTNHSESVFSNIAKIINYLSFNSSEKAVKERIRSWIGAFIHFKRYMVENLPDEFLISYEYLNMNLETSSRFMNEDKLNQFEEYTRRSQRDFNIYLGHNTSLLFNMFNIYMRTKKIPIILSVTAQELFDEIKNVQDLYVVWEREYIDFTNELKQQYLEK